ncbi:MAG TPA: outer membrane beta-barrel protein [Opitutaceae bacterium]|nr:outer membrane beta-barrel protein [Opitutaceae bacterium]HND62506.1 outer membrane beta-barrel protein [Opitutaceae bacterium]
MPFLPTLRAAVALLLALCLVCPPARALVTFNDGREHIYVTGSAGIGYDSNLFAHNQGGGDTLYTASVLAEYTRRAGWIGVNASVGLNLSQFVDHTDQNSTDPRLALEFVKGGGRTTGGLSLSAVREHRADSAANLRAESWNYNGTLTVKYPVMERYSVAGTAGYSEQVYDAKYNLSNLQTTSIGADLLYALESDRDLILGYRYRVVDSSRNAAFNDQSFTVGVSGRVMGRLTGSLRVGYQIRDPRNHTIGGDFRGLTALGELTYTPSKRFSVSGQLSRDLSVTSTDLSVDTFSGSITPRLTFNSRISVFANVGGGTTRFLGINAAGRRDQFFTFGGGVDYTISQHLKAELAYTYFQNWSSLAYADYARNYYTLSLTSRW